MYYNQELGLCIEFGPVRVDSVRRGGGPPPWIKSPLRRFTPSWTSTRVDCLLPFVHPLLSQVYIYMFNCLYYIYHIIYYVAEEVLPLNAIYLYDVTTCLDTSISELTCFFAQSTESPEGHPSFRSHPGH